MQYQVFVQSHPERRYVASVVGIPNSTVEASTRDEAILKAKVALEEQLANGELVTIDIHTPPFNTQTAPLLKHIGIFADDPTFDDFLAEVAAYRQQADAQDLDS